MALHLETTLTAQGDQPKAIDLLVESLSLKKKHQVLLGVTGSGKTFTIANVLSRLNRSALIIAPNKTLAAQLYTEFKQLFPKSPVGFFISYYDYYQPEAYVPSTDTYIAKDSSINDDIDKMRHETTRYLFEEKNAIIIASVSCIYGLGSPKAYAKQRVGIQKGQQIERDSLLKQLVAIQYKRNDYQLQRGAFRVQGDTVDILPSHENERATRVEFFGDEIESITMIDSLTGKSLNSIKEIHIYPNSHYVPENENVAGMVEEILQDLGKQLAYFKENQKLVEHQRLETRTMHDIETLTQLGFCPGIENYSRYITQTAPGFPPPTLLDYFSEDFITIIDESHITIPQIAGMYRGDRSRKQTLVDFGFRLPSALDNRPLNYQEFLQKTGQIIHVSATPSAYDLEIAQGQIIEQIIRPTGLIDPKIEIKPCKNQVDDLYGEIKKTLDIKGRVLITTLTKKLAEDLCEYYKDLGVSINYLHSDIDSLERANLLRKYRQGEFDVVIGINLLREGLDLPEVKLVAILDADKEGFLRSRSSLIQTVGRAARNVDGRVIFYADKTTDSMRQAIEETERRRKIQIAYNKKHNIIPKSIVKEIPQDIRAIYGLLDKKEEKTDHKILDILKEKKIKSSTDLEKLIVKKTKEMQELSKKLKFEQAATIRDEIKELKGLMIYFGTNNG